MIPSIAPEQVGTTSIVTECLSSTYEYVVVAVTVYITCCTDPPAKPIASILAFKNDVQQLFRLIKESERPALIHCKSGADRTGLASIIALLMNEEADLNEIQKQSSWRYLAFSPDSTGKLFMQQYRLWLGKRNQPHSREIFSKWVEKEYVDDSSNFYFLVHPINGQLWERPAGGYEEGNIFSIQRSSTKELELDGWAFDTLHEAPVKDIEIYLDDFPLNKPTYGNYLPHLIHDFGKENYLYTGWVVKQPLDTLENGCYNLTIRLTGLDERKWT